MPAALLAPRGVTAARGCAARSPVATERVGAGSPADRAGPRNPARAIALGEVATHSCLGPRRVADRSGTTLCRECYRHVAGAENFFPRRGELFRRFRRTLPVFDRHLARACHGEFAGGQGVRDGRAGGDGGAGTDGERGYQYAVGTGVRIVTDRGGVLGGAVVVGDGG